MRAQRVEQPEDEVLRRQLRIDELLPRDGTEQHVRGGPCVILLGARSGGLIAAIGGDPLHHQRGGDPVVAMPSGGGNDVAVDLLGIGKPGHRRIAKRLAGKLDNPLIAAILGSLIDGKGGIAGAEKRRHACRHRRHHIIAKRGDIFVVKSGIAAKRPVRGHIGKKGFHKAVPLGLQGEDAVELHEGGQAGGNGKGLGLEGGHHFGIAVPCKDTARRSADGCQPPADQGAVAILAGKVEGQDLACSSRACYRKNVFLGQGKLRKRIGIVSVAGSVRRQLPDTHQDSTAF